MYTGNVYTCIIKYIIILVRTGKFVDFQSNFNIIQHVTSRQWTIVQGTTITQLPECFASILLSISTKILAKHSGSCGPITPSNVIVQMASYKSNLLQ